MDWKRLIAGEPLRCSCGGTFFGRVLPGTVVWWAESNGTTPPGVLGAEHRCARSGNRKCGKTWVSVQAPPADPYRPPLVAA